MGGKKIKVREGPCRGAWVWDSNVRNLEKLGKLNQAN